MHLSILLLLWIGTSALAYNDESYYEDEVDSFQLARGDLSGGREEYERLTNYAKMPHYGQCWTRALANLQTGCHKLTEETQMRLAMDFANCFLEKAGLHTFTCDAEVSIASCINAAKVEPNFFAAYLQFFTHTQNICFYLSSELFQKRAESQVNNLLKSSDFVTENLKKSEKMQGKIVDLQQAALESTVKTSDMQALIHESQQKSLEISEKSQQALQRNFFEMQRSVGETRQWVGDIAERITRLQSVFIDEFTGFYSWMFYFISTLAIFLVTSTSYTAAARIWLFLLIGSTFFLERFLNQHRLASFESADPEFLPDAGLIKEVLNRDSRLIRQCFWAISTCILLYFAFTYRDVNEDTKRRLNELLSEIHAMRLQMNPSEKRTVDAVLDKSETIIKGLDERDTATSWRRSLSRQPLESYSRPVSSSSFVARDLTPVLEENSNDNNSPQNNGYFYGGEEKENVVRRLIREFSVDREVSSPLKSVVDRLADVTSQTRERIDRSRRSMSVDAE